MPQLLYHVWQKLAKTCFCQDGLNRCWQKLANSANICLQCQMIPDNAMQCYLSKGLGKPMAL